MATFGQTTPGTVDQQDGGGLKRGSKFTLSEQGNISSVSLYCKAVNVGTVKITMAVYIDNGSNVPTDRELVSAETSFTNTTDAWVTCNVSPVVNLVAGDYWLVWTNDGGTGTGGLYFGETTLADGIIYNGDTYATLSDPFGGSLTYQAFQASIYATYTAGGPLTGGNFLAFL